MTRDEESAVIRQVLAGDTDQFAQLVAAHERGVYNLALRMLGNEQDALDASQEAFFRAWQALASFRGESRLSVWLYRVTSNVCLDMLRRAGRLRTGSLTDEEGGELPLPDESADPQRLLEQKERAQAVREGLALLEPAFRQALVLREINGLSYEKIAQVTGLDMGTVKSRIFRARRKLAAILERSGNFSGAPASYDEAGKGGGEHA